MDLSFYTHAILDHVKLYVREPGQRVSLCSMPMVSPGPRKYSVTAYQRRTALTLSRHQVSINSKSIGDRAHHM